MLRMIMASTQRVIASGTQISKPVMKYFFRAKTVWLGSSAACGWTGTTAALTWRRGGFGLGFRFGFRRRLTAALEVSGVPATTLELKAGSGQLLAKGGFLTF